MDQLLLHPLATRNPDQHERIENTVDMETQSGSSPCNKDHEFNTGCFVCWVKADNVY